MYVRGLPTSGYLVGGHLHPAPSQLSEREGPQRPRRPLSGGVLAADVLEQPQFREPGFVPESPVAVAAGLQERVACSAPLLVGRGGVRHAPLEGELASQVVGVKHADRPVQTGGRPSLDLAGTKIGFRHC
jgi:hypothetical protein